MNMHFISVATDLTEISLGLSTLEVVFFGSTTSQYHQFPGASQRYTFNPVQIHNNALVLKAKGASRRRNLFLLFYKEYG